MSISGWLAIVDGRRLRFIAFSGVVVLGAAGLLGVHLATGARTPDAVRQRMYADLRADRLSQCSAALDWLRRHDRMISEDWMVRARIEDLQGRPDSALDCLNRVGDRDPLAAQARLMSGTIWLKLHRARPAEAALRKAVELDPGQYAARLELIQLYSRQQRFTELNAQFEGLADRDRLDFAYLRFWFMTRNTPWDVKGDLTALRRMAEADPDDLWSRLAWAEGLRRLGRADEADEVLERIPESATDALAIRACVAIDRGDLERAERFLARDREDSAAADRLRGQLALRHEDARSAVRWFRKAYECAPDDRVTLTGLATALRLLGRASDADPLLARIRRLDEFSPLMNRIAAATAAEDTDLHLRLGSICEALGRRSEARAWYRLVIARNPLDAPAQQAVFRLGTAVPPP